MLERKAGNILSASEVSGQREYAKKCSYSAFAEMYLEKQTDVQAGITCSICTWRGIPTIDDW